MHVRLIPDLFFPSMCLPLYSDAEIRYKYAVYCIGQSRLDSRVLYFTLSYIPGEKKFTFKPESTLMKCKKVNLRTQGNLIIYIQN
jgi:hypothetical protein